MVVSLHLAKKFAGSSITVWESIHKNQVLNLHIHIFLLMLLTMAHISGAPSILMVIQLRTITTLRLKLRKLIQQICAVVQSYTKTRSSILSQGLTSVLFTALTNRERKWKI